MSQAAMTTFAGTKPLAQIRQQCLAQGVQLDSERHDTIGDDYVVLRGGGAEVFFSAFNGKFFGTTDTGVAFSSCSTEHEDQPWFQQLLRFFYFEKAAADRPDLQPAKHPPDLSSNRRPGDGDQAFDARFTAAHYQEGRDLLPLGAQEVSGG